jgi:DNA-binding beta-propeller fold protein YncE
LLTDTQEGTIEGYNPSVSLTSTVQILSTTGAFYTSIDLSKNRVYAANFATGSVDVFDGTSTPFPALAPINDADLIAAEYHAYAVTVYKKHLYVAYANNLGTNSSQAGEGLGYIDASLSALNTSTEVAT